MAGEPGLPTPSGMGENARKEKLKALEESRDVPEGLLRAHLDRLDPDYLDQFSAAEIKGHLAALGQISGGRLCRLLFVPREEPGRFAVTLVGYDCFGLFSIVSGVLTLTGFEIEAGKIYTYRDLVSPAPAPGADARMIIDFFEVTHAGKLAEDFQEILESELNGYLLMVKENRYWEVRRALYNRMGHFLSQLPDLHKRRLMPITVRADATPEHTVLYIHGIYTPAFLFALSNALAVRHISIRKILHTQRENRVENVVFITDEDGRPITDPEFIRKLKTAVALIKQFTLFLPVAPDFDSAVRHFDSFLDDLLAGKIDPSGALDVTSDTAMAALARIFGSGSYLWEEFVKMQHENLLPRLKHIDEIKGRKPKEEIVRELRAAIAAAGGEGGEAAVAALNRFKDAELFRIDLLYLIYPSKTFIQFSEELSDLAEAIITEAAEMAFSDLAGRHGEPRFAGRPCGYSLLALGKLGGRELGYASDIELVLVYEGLDEDGDGERLSNPAFFAAMVEGLSSRIRAKHSGIFEIDLRLRPHGISGPLASSLPRWREYYAPAGPDGPGGEAHDYERQSLIKLRPICGRGDLSPRIMEERDALIFREEPVGIAGQLDLRRKQLKEKVKGGKVNAKYSEGGLAELEYSVQFLQLRHGRRHPALRNPNTIRALEGLLEHGILSPSEFEILYNGYAFLRRLINVLREVRGNALDLALPEPGSDQFQYLARRLGYAPKAGKPPDAQLGEDIARHLRNVNGFFRKNFLGETPQASGDRGLPEAILPENPPGEAALAAVAALGVSDPAKGLRILRDIAAHVKDRNALAAALVLAGPHILKSPDPDAAVLHLGAYLMNCPDADALIHQMVYYPRYLELLVCIFGFSETLSDFLIRRPDLIHTLADETYLGASKTAMQLKMEVEADMADAKTLDERVEGVRFFKMKELLRIGLGEIFLDNPLSRTTKELSNLADAVVSTVYHLVLHDQRRWELADHQAVLALGKLGGQELNYSSDIDLIFVHAPQSTENEGYVDLERIDKLLIHHLTATGLNGQLYRVDLKLRPYGGQGAVTGSLGYHKDYYETKADGWELQAWLKARPVAGNLDMGRQLVKDVQEILLRPENREKAFRSILKLRRMVLDRLASRSSIPSEIKSGPGGIRTIEFLVQYEQIRHGKAYPEIISGHTLNSMAVLRKYDLMAPNLFRILRDGYIFLRRIENRIQLYGMQQRHTLPSQPEELAKLAKRMGFEDRLNVTALSQFMDQYRYHLFVLAEISGHFSEQGETEAGP